MMGLCKALFKMKNMAMLFLLFSIVGCNGQEKEKLEKKETELKPKGEWKVQKEYDKHGNLIKYDSIYSWSYSNIKGDSLNINLDSIMDSFRNYFNDTSPFKWKEDFSYFPKNDSLLMNDFFRDDYFFKNWKRQQLEMEKIMRQMDSTRNEFLRKFHPGLMESKEKDHKI